MNIIKIVLTSLFILATSTIFARKVTVTDYPSLVRANDAAQPGDTIVLKNGTWSNIVMNLTCSGTSEKPIVFMAQTRGGVLITGTSQLRIGGEYVTVDGLVFRSGSTPGTAVIEYRTANKSVANHCRVTNCVIDDFNKSQRMKEDYWIAFYGKNNRLDHCSFFNKKNLGVLLAVILDDDRSRENFHSIDHNYFGIRPPLGSNGGEIIRVGVSEHCQYNSNTQIRNNLFEYCDGETEIVSIKSGGNVVHGNVFKECQGSVVLRHGNYNTVSDNLFLGNGKTATGGVRVINRGQWVINNFFYQCRGESFRSPLAIMNGIPNSPANRYVQVTDAVIMNNTFYDCAPVSFGEGSDAERTLPPENVLFAKNMFYNVKDSSFYHAWDKTDGIRFIENKITRNLDAGAPVGFQAVSFSLSTTPLPLPTTKQFAGMIGLDSLKTLSANRLPNVTAAPGFTGRALMEQLLKNAKTDCGAKWYKPAVSNQKFTTVNCNSAEQVYAQLSKGSGPLRIVLTAQDYDFTKRISVNRSVVFTSSKKQVLNFHNSTESEALFTVEGNGNLTLDKLKLTFDGNEAQAFVASDSLGSAQHYSVVMTDLTLTNTIFDYIFYAHKSMIADSIVLRNSNFLNQRNGLSLAGETDNKGYYNAEKIVIANCGFIDGAGTLLNIYRGGNDESTLGPDLRFVNNKIRLYQTRGQRPLIELTGVQRTEISYNQVSRANPEGILINYKDIVRAKHESAGNRITDSGKTVTQVGSEITTTAN